MNLVRRLSLAVAPLLVAALLSACATGGGSVLATPAGLQAQAALATTAVLQYAVKAPDRPRVARYAYTAAAAVRSLSGGTAPTPAELQAAIVTFGGPSDPFIALLASSLVSLYQAEFPRIQAADSARILVTLEALARGVESGASLYASATG